MLKKCVAKNQLIWYFSFFIFYLFTIFVRITRWIYSVNATKKMLFYNFRAVPTNEYDKVFLSSSQQRSYRYPRSNFIEFCKLRTVIYWQLGASNVVFGQKIRADYFILLLSVVYKNGMFCYHTLWSQALGLVSCRHRFKTV